MNWLKDRLFDGLCWFCNLPEYAQLMIGIGTVGIVTILVTLELQRLLLYLQFGI